MIIIRGNFRNKVDGAWTLAYNWTAWSSERARRLMTWSKWALRNDLANSMLMLLCYLGAPAAPRPFLSWYCQGCQPDSGMWPSPAAGRGWPAASRMAALPSGSQGQKSAGGPPCSSATGWWELGHPRPHSAAGQCHQDTLTLTQSEQPPSVDLRGDKRQKMFSY